MKQGNFTPWGKAQTVNVLCEGAWLVSTSRHGGVKLDAARNRKVPAPVRKAGGWYEEDCNWAVPCKVHPDVSAALLALSTCPADRWKAVVAQTIQRWQSPDGALALGV